MDTQRSQQNDTLDAICWRHYGRTAGVTEQVLAANPGLAELGARLPAGLLINLPVQDNRAEAPTINLWD